MSYNFWYGVIGALVMLIVVAITTIGYQVGYVEGQHSMPSICEPKCEFVYRGTKLINVTCPDSLGRLP